MRFLLPFLALITLCLLLACSGDDGVSVPYQSFSASVTLTNADGEPLPDYTVGLSSLAYPYPYLYGRPETDITFNLYPDSTWGALDAYVAIHKYWNTPVHVLVDSVYAPGTAPHSIGWDGLAGDGQLIADGVYKLVISFIYENHENSNGERVFYYYQAPTIPNDMFDPTRPDMALTGQAGDALLTDITPLPGLYCAAPILMNYDEEGNPTEHYTPSPISYILVRSPQGEVRMAQREMTTGANTFSLVWQELTPAD